jgi:hypothetical protein
MDTTELRSAAEKRLANLREYDSVLALNGVICLGLTLALLLGEPAGGLLFGALALLSFVTRRRLRRFGRTLERELAGLGKTWSDSAGPALAARLRLSFWQIVVAR